MKQTLHWSVGEALLLKHRVRNTIAITVVYCYSHAVQHYGTNWKAIISVTVLKKFSVHIFLCFLNWQHQGNRLLWVPTEWFSTFQCLSQCCVQLINMCHFRGLFTLFPVVQVTAAVPMTFTNSQSVHKFKTAYSLLSREKLLCSDIENLKLNSTSGMISCSDCLLQNTVSCRPHWGCCKMAFTAASAFGQASCVLQVQRDCGCSPLGGSATLPSFHNIFCGSS